MDDRFSALVARLTGLMREAAVGMTEGAAGPDGAQFYAAWEHPRKPGEPMWFGGVRRGKAYVSYHLMPVYSHAALAAEISPALRKRMQGKSCFNFKVEDEALFAELADLTRKGAEIYARGFRV